MKRNIMLPLFALLLCTAVPGAERITERVFLHADKDCYLAGERMWIKFYVAGPDFSPSKLSKVGYVELRNNEQGGVQRMFALEGGRAGGCIDLPADLPSGLYTLTGYTRYMRNETPQARFSRPIAVVNTFVSSPADRVERIAEPFDALAPEAEGALRIGVRSDKALYAPRQRVEVTLDGIPADAQELTLSVARRDRMVGLPPADMQAWRRTEALAATQQGWLPEYEGHIFRGRILSPPSEKETLGAMLACVGDDLCLVGGQVTPQGEVSFYSGGLYGRHDLLCIATDAHQRTYKVDLLSPYAADPGPELPALRLYADERTLRERSIGVQLSRLVCIDSLATPSKEPYYPFRCTASYLLDDYNRFGTMRETITEFVYGVAVRRIEGQERLMVVRGSDNRSNLGSTLVMLDGVPVMDHNSIIEYDPHKIRRIDVYDGTYLFGGKIYDCMLAFYSFSGSLSGIRLSEDSQLVVYDCPMLPLPFAAPSYEAEQPVDPRRPDPRHTLYWNPEVRVEGGRATLRFYTSDTKGEFEIKAEGIDSQGRLLTGRAVLRVE